MTLNYSHHFSFPFFGSGIVIWQWFGVDKFRYRAVSRQMFGRP